MSYQIFTDSTANLPDDLTDQYGIGIVPLSYQLNGVLYAYPRPSEFDGHAFYDMLRGGVSVTTSLAGSGMFEDAFSPVLDQGTDVLFISLSSGVSGTYQSACLAAEALTERYPERRICCFDTRAASLGAGLQVLAAARAKAEGSSLDAVLEMLEEMRPRMCQVFTVDDLHNLKRGGRLSAAAALVGTVLHIKPLLKGDEEGKIAAWGKVRGRQKAMEALETAFAEEAVEAEKQTVGIAHCDCEADALALREALLAHCPGTQVLVVGYEPVTGAHVGPDALALFYLGAHR